MRGGDPWVALCPVPLPLRPCPHGRRKRPHSTAPLSRPYECDDLLQKNYCGGVRGCSCLFGVVIYLVLKDFRGQCTMIELDGSISPNNTMFVPLCFEVPDVYSPAGGLGTRVTELS